MSLTDPLSVTISGNTISLPRISVGDDRSEYSSGDGLTTFIASHDYGKRTRRTARINTKKIAPNPLETTVNREESMSFYIVYDLPRVGYTAAEALAVSSGLIAMLTASSNAALVKLLGGEN
jgi:hypothetical protein